MAWVKLDDAFADHPKVLAAGPAGLALWVCGLAYCNRQKARDGFIPAAKVPLLYPVPNAAKAAAHLVEIGLWERTAGGYRVHDYHDYQPTADEASDLREKRAEAGRRGGKRSGAVRRAAAASEPTPTANEQQVASHSASKPEANCFDTNEANGNPVPVPVPEERTEPLLPSVVVAPPAPPVARVTDTRTHRVRTHFALRYRETLGHDYVAHFAKDGDHLKRIPATYSAEDLCGLVDQFFTQADEFSRTKAGLTIPEFVRRIPSLQGQALPTRAVGKLGDTMRDLQEFSRAKELA